LTKPVIGSSIYNQLKQALLRDPIGQQIRVGNSIFTIIGVAKAGSVAKQPYKTTYNLLRLC
jgi:hypothetical protein